MSSQAFAPSSDGRPFIPTDYTGFVDRDSIHLDGLTISIARAEKTCPVCGEPNGNCTPEGYEPPTEIEVVGEWLAKPDDKTFRVPHDVFMETQLSKSNVLRRCVAKEGDMISPKFAAEIGLA